MLSRLDCPGIQEENAMKLPKPVYESIPALYVLTGIIAISGIDSFMSFISGILMGGSGIAIMCLRRNHRIKRELEQIHIS